MSYDILLEKRLKKIVTNRRGFYIQKMFGGVAFMLHGNVCFGIWKDHLILRLGEHADAALKRPYVKPFDVTGRPMKGWVMVSPQGMTADATLKGWVEQAIRFGSTLVRR